MSTTSNSAANDMPADQREAAKQAHLNPNEPAVNAAGGTPQYGAFGKPDSGQGMPSRSGSNDNPDEFSEIRDPEDAIPRDGTTTSGDPNPLHQTGYVQQNRDPEAVRKAQGDAPGHRQQEEDNTREAWAQDDERYAGGHREASWQEESNKEHGNS